MDPAFAPIAAGVDGPSPVVPQISPVRACTDAYVTSSPDQSLDRRCCENVEPVAVKVSATSAKIIEWVETWMQMCADGDLVHTSLNDDERARTVYDLSSRHLRSVRSAVLTGALTRRAAELGVELPEGFVSDLPQRINRHQPADAAA